MDQAEALLQSHRVEDISEKIEPVQIKKIFSQIFWFSQAETQPKTNTYQNENGKIDKIDDIELVDSLLEAPIIEINTEDKDDAYFLFYYTLFRKRMHAKLRKGKNLAVNFGQKVLSVDKEVVASTLKTLRKKREDYLTMIREIKNNTFKDNIFV